MRAQWFFVLALAVCRPVDAFSWSFEPANPRAADLIRLRLDIDPPCDTTTAAVTVDAALQRVNVAVSSSPGACDIDNPAHTATPRFFNVGQLPAGTYVVEFESCQFPPPPLPPCGVFQTRQLVVAGQSAQQFTIPALSHAVAAMAAMLMLLLAWASGRRG